MSVCVCVLFVAALNTPSVLEIVFHLFFFFLFSLQLAQITFTLDLDLHCVLSHRTVQLKKADLVVVQTVQQLILSDLPTYATHESL